MFYSRNKNTYQTHARLLWFLQKKTGLLRISQNLEKREKCYLKCEHGPNMKKKKNKANYAIKKKTKINKPWLAGVIMKLIYRHKGWESSKTQNLSVFSTQHCIFFSPQTCRFWKFTTQVSLELKLSPDFSCLFVRAPTVYWNWPHNDEPCVLLGGILRSNTLDFVHPPKTISRLHTQYRHKSI